MEREDEAVLGVPVDDLEKIEIAPSRGGGDGTTEVHIDALKDGGGAREGS